MKYNYDLTISQNQWPVPTVGALNYICDEISNFWKGIVNRSSTTCSGWSRLAEDYNLFGTIKELTEIQQCTSDSKTLTWDTAPSIATDVVGKRYAEVYIYYKNLATVSITEFETYGIADVVAYMGGIVGLFFGFTIMTIFEFFFFAVDLLIIGVFKIFGKKSSPVKRGSISPYHKTISPMQSNLPIAPPAYQTRYPMGQPGPGQPTRLYSMQNYE